MINKTPAFNNNLQFKTPVPKIKVIAAEISKKEEETRNKLYHVQSITRNQVGEGSPTISANNLQSQKPALLPGYYGQSIGHDIIGYLLLVISNPVASELILPKVSTRRLALLRANLTSNPVLSIPV
jgi:hypothetical protein